MRCTESGRPKWSFAAVNTLLGGLWCQRHDIRSNVRVRLAKSTVMQFDEHRCLFQSLVLCQDFQISIEDGDACHVRTKQRENDPTATRNAKYSELNFGSEPEHHRALNAAADICVVLNHRLYEQHRQGV
jgi:hypothetical protein